MHLRMFTLLIYLTIHKPNMASFAPIYSGFLTIWHFWRVGVLHSGLRENRQNYLCIRLLYHAVDEYFKERSIEHFTGAFVGMCCQYLTGALAYADFDYFSYSVEPY